MDQHVRVQRDSVKGWRVTCSVHGELASYSRFWTAARDCAQHRGNCPISEGETAPAGEVEIAGRLAGARGPGRQ